MQHSNDGFLDFTIFPNVYVKKIDIIQCFVMDSVNYCWETQLYDIIWFYKKSASETYIRIDSS